MKLSFQYDLGEGPQSVAVPPRVLVAFEKATGKTSTDLGATSIQVDLLRFAIGYQGPTAELLDRLEEMTLVAVDPRQPVEGQPTA
jgi:hypothetical protein